MEDKHTPGPWKFDDTNGCRRIKGGKIGTNRQGQYQDIAWTVGLHDDERDKANAKLITQAPIMFEFIKRLADSGDREAKKIIYG